MTFDQFNTALSLASQRGLLPSALSSAGQRAAFSAALRGASVFSARVTNARFLQGVGDAVAGLLQGGLDNDKGQLRLALRALLTKLGYTPEAGFKGDARRGVPSAEAGTLQDLRSAARLNLILDTQAELIRGSALAAQGMSGSRVAQFPCWELVRHKERKQPRGILQGSSSWATRWVALGGPAPIFTASDNGPMGEGRMIALKTDPIWQALGDSAHYDDALDVAHPPFAFKSGMGWNELHRTEAAALGFPSSHQPSTINHQPAALVPTPRMGQGNLNADAMARLRAKLDALRAINPNVYGRLNS